MDSRNEIRDFLTSRRAKITASQDAPNLLASWTATPHQEPVARGSKIIELRPGDSIYTPPGEWHWHGAAPGHFMIRIAMWERPDEVIESEWGEQVTDEEYGGGDQG